MNERIRLLIEQATSTQGPTPYNPLTFEVFDKEKFAQLIVRECCTMVNKHMQHNNPNDCLLVLDIKEHFGVEE